MRSFTQPERLTDAELDRLGDILESCKGRMAMNVEQLDGFFAAGSRDGSVLDACAVYCPCTVGMLKQRD